MGDKGDHIAITPHSSCSTGTVGIGLYITGDIVVNHTLKMFNIDSTSDQIGGQQEGQLMVFEAFQNNLAVFDIDITGERYGLNAPVL